MVAVQRLRLFQRFSFQRLSVSKKISQAVDDLMAVFFLLPSAALPASGSRGLRSPAYRHQTLSHAAPPLYSIYIHAQNKAETGGVNAEPGHCSLALDPAPDLDPLKVKPLKR